MKFKNFIYQAWKVMECYCQSWKDMEINVMFDGLVTLECQSKDNVRLRRRPVRRGVRWVGSHPLPQQTPEVHVFVDTRFITK